MHHTLHMYDMCNVLFSWKEGGCDIKGQPPQPSDNGVRNPGFQNQLGDTWWLAVVSIQCFKQACHGFNGSESVAK